MALKKSKLYSSLWSSIKNFLCKRWYYVPALIGLLIGLLHCFCFLWVHPDLIDLDNGSRINLKSKSYQILLQAKLSGDEEYTYTLHSVPPLNLNESWLDNRDLWNGALPGFLFGNLDFDAEQELLVLSCEENLETTVIPSSSLGMNGYYDFNHGVFQYKHLRESPLQVYLKSDFVDLFIISDLNIWEFGFVLLSFVLVTGRFLVKKARILILKNSAKP